MNAQERLHLLKQPRVILSLLYTYEDCSWDVSTVASVPETDRVCNFPPTGDQSETLAGRVFLVGL